MDEAVNHTLKSTRDKLFYLSNVLYLWVIPSDLTLFDQAIVLPCNI